MALKVVSMTQIKLELLLEAERSAESVTSICKRYGISRQTFYEYRKRYRAEGTDGLEERSRAPYSSPKQIDVDLEVEICRMRKDHPRWGARRIHAEMLRTGANPPAISTIHRAMKRNHLVADHARHRPKFNKRFVREQPNDLWQLDATQVKVVKGKLWVMNALDDHARFLLSAIACKGPTGEAAVRCFEQAAGRYGLPRQVLTDNGLCFTGKLSGFEVQFELKLQAIGVQLINSGPYHPQTLGKLERFHQTQKQWLADEGPAANLGHLQGLLDRFREHYNEQRPHQAIDESTPGERYRKSLPMPISKPVLPETLLGDIGLDSNGDPVYPPFSLIRKVNKTGYLGFDNMTITVGLRWAGAKMRIVESGELIQIYYGPKLIRVLSPDRTRRHQPLNIQRGRKVRPWQ